MNSIDDLEILNIAIPDLPEDGRYSHHPISKGQSPHFYKPIELLDTAEAKTGWMDFFEKILVGLFWKLGRPVPYAFRTFDGTIRSLDAGCIKFLKNRSPAEVNLDVDAMGYIHAIKPNQKLLDRYEAMKEKLVARLDPPSND